VEGWVSLHRKVRYSAVWQDPELFRLWCLCLLKATHKPHSQLIGNQTVELKPGQFVTGREALAEEYNRDLSPSKRVKPITVWRWLQKLEKLENLNIKSTNKYSVVTIVNWSEYQDSEQQMNNKRSANEQQKITNNNGNNDNNLNDNNNPADQPLPDPFEEQLTDEQRLEKEIADYYETKKGRFAKPTDWDFIRKAIEEKFTRDEMIQGINLAFLQAKSINSFEYCLKVMRTEREKRLRQQKKKVVPMQRQQRPGRKEKLPEALRPESQQIAPQLTPEELAEKQRQIQEKLKRMNERIAQKGVY
jgi:hypothetical protein